MWPLQSVQLEDEDVFSACTSKLRNINDIHARLAGAQQTIMAEWADYSVKGAAIELHQLVPNDVTAGTLNKNEMIRIYESGLLRAGAGRHVYDAIMALAPQRRCPFCGHRRVRTLDHFLPKSKYPVFSVSPQNLIPSCIECNKDKSADDPNSREETSFHPYFENIDGITWLKASVQQEVLAVFKFEVDENAGLDAVSLTRAQKQFHDLGLDNLYSIEASEHLSSIRLTLRDIYRHAGRDGVKQHLKADYNSSNDHRRNAWRTAFYKAAYKSRWFCDGGFDDPDLN